MNYGKYESLTFSLSLQLVVGDLFPYLLEESISMVSKVLREFELIQVHKSDNFSSGFVDNLTIFW